MTAPTERESRIWRLISMRAHERGSTRIEPSDVCVACAAAVGVDGVALSAVSPRGRLLVAATHELSARIDELQDTWSEGPALAVAASGGRVVVADLHAAEVVRRWPGFAPAAVRAGVAAIVALPLWVGSATVGTLVLHRVEPGPPGIEALADAKAFGDAAAALLVEYRAEIAADPAGGFTPLGEDQAVVFQAAGMVSVQLGVDVDEARLRLGVYAVAHDRSITGVARDVVARALRFGDRRG